MISVNRRRVAELEGRYPSVRFECVDVRSAKDVEDLVRGLTASGELPDVFILNAGINRLDNDEAFDLPLYREVIDTNLFGVLNFIAPLTQVPAVDVERHVVAISSMVTLRRQPLWPRVSDEQAGSDNLLRRVVQHVHGDGPGLQAGHPGTRSHLDLHDGREAPRLDGPDARASRPRRWTARSAPISRFARTRKKKLDPSLAGRRRVRCSPARHDGSFRASSRGSRTLEGRPRRKAG